MNNEEKILSMLETLMQGQTELKAEVKGLKQDIVRIENEHGKKLDAVFDGYSQLYDVSQEIRTNIAALQVSQEKQELHIKWHDSQLKTE